MPTVSPICKPSDDSTHTSRSLSVRAMRLSEYPYVTVRVACSKCPRKGAYRLARLAERYGASITMPAVLSHLAADCASRDVRFGSANFCGAHFPDMPGSRPPDSPADAVPRLRVVR